MYLEHFGLKENPFSIVPDPRYFYLSEGHREALAHLVYGVNSDGGFILLTGDIGTGKTTTFRYLLDLLPEHTEIAFILNPNLKVEELLEAILKEFRIEAPSGEKSNEKFVAAIYDHLLDLSEKGRKAILVVEEAQNLSPEVLEQIRLLTNLETRQRKLLQIILIGQPELREMVERPSLEQLAQRITARYHLGPLSREETFAYVRHRLSLAGGDPHSLFPKKTLNRLYRLSGGVPRLINLTCDRALLGAFVQDKNRVDVRTLQTAAREVFGRRQPTGVSIPLNLPRLLVILFLALGLLSASFFYWRPPSHWDLFRRLPLTEAKAVKTPPQTPFLTLEMPAGLTSEETEKAAFKALMRRWGLPEIEEERSVCERIPDYGLQCLKDKGGLSELRELNAPAVLTLRDETGRKYFAALLALEGSRATLAVGETRGTMDIREIGTRWLGEYTIFWKTPPGYTGKAGSWRRGPVLQWIDQQLALLQGRQGGSFKRPADDLERERAIRAFQVSIGLFPDGIAGPRTLIGLARAAGEGGPTLTEDLRRP